MTRTLRLALCISGLGPMTVFAWLYPEHREITVLAIRMLNPEQRSVLDQMWSEARSGYETRLCSNMTAGGQAPKPACIDYASWPSIAGDHSCSANEMLQEVLDESWVLKVAAIGGRLKTKLAATGRNQRLNALRRSDIDLLRADPDMVRRAQSNNAHFLLARPDAAMEPPSYVAIVLGPGAELNAVGTYTLYHVRALATAVRVAEGRLTAEVRVQAALSAFADEAFALHFLEDSFAAGHVTGNWGNSAIRKGTHDYYNEHGVEIRTWNGNHFVGFGDGYLGPDDAKRAGAAVRDSLAQLASAFSGKLRLTASNSNLGALQPDVFNVCHATHFPSAVVEQQDIQTVVPVIAQTPIPALGDVPGQLPRFRSELGPFVGTSAAALGEALNGGFGSNQSGVSGIGGLETAVRLGVGLEGVLDEAGDGLVFADAGYRENARSQGAAAIPSRGALSLRLRAPFWLIPGDLVATAPVLGLVSRRTLDRMAVQAGNGGLIPWQTGIATPIGRFQFELGREVNVSWYKLDTGNAMLLPTPGVAPFDRTLVAVKSMEFDFPIVEYRPFRAFSRNQTSSLIVQLYAGFNKPTESEVVSPAGAPSPQLRTIGLAGIRVAFDWRYYVK